MIESEGQRLLWLVVGMIFGIMIADFWRQLLEARVRIREHFNNKAVKAL